MVSWSMAGSRLQYTQALDLCLSCKGCARDCPTGIDMAAYKSQVLHHSYRRKIRPRSHYALGWLPRWGRLITRARPLSGLINVSTATPGVRTLLRWAAGIDQRRSLPRFASVAARKRVAVPESSGDPAIVWVDSFSDYFTGDADRRGRLGAGRGRLCAAAGGTTSLLWPDLDQHRSARRRSPTAAHGIGHPASLRRCGNAGGRPGTLLSRGLAQRRGRTVAR